MSACAYLNVSVFITTGWKYGQITPLHKKDSMLDKASFRPVTMLPAFNKVFERTVHTQIVDILIPSFGISCSRIRNFMAVLLYY